MPAERVVLIEFEDDWIEELIPMWRASFEDGVGITDPHPIEDQRKYFMTEVLRHYGVRLAVQDAGLVGFVAASRESIAQLYVRIGFQHRGIGTRLLELGEGALWRTALALHVCPCGQGMLRPQPVIDHDCETLPIAVVRGSLTSPHNGRREQLPALET